LISPFGRGDTGPIRKAFSSWQFGLGELLLTVSTVAVTLGLTLLAAPYSAWFLELAQFFYEETGMEWRVLCGAMILDVVLVTLLAAWATLPKRLLDRRLGWVALIAALWPPTCSVLTVTAFLPPDIKPGWKVMFWRMAPHAYYEFLLLFMCLAGSFLVVRLAGCRLVRAESNAQEGGDSRERTRGRKGKDKGVGSLCC